MEHVADALETARQAHADGDWARAFSMFVRARQTGPLTADDLTALGDVAWWLGHTDTYLDVSAVAVDGLLQEGRVHAAAMAALELAVSLALRGEEAHASGWLGRAQRLLADVPECPAHGFFRYVVEVEGGLTGDDLDAVAAAAREVQALGRRHDDPTLVASGILGEGRALVRLGDVTRGLRLLDEAMLAVLHGGLDPAWAGNIYCHLMAACHELQDVARAREWTDATWEWLSTLPAAVLFTGICRVHRSQTLQVTGDWEQSEQEVVRVIDDLDGIHVASVAEAHYQLGELHRLRGALDAADRAYERARALGREPQPGVALLRLAQRRLDDARAGIDAALLATSTDRLARARLCRAKVEVALAAGDLDGGRDACLELEEAAVTYGTSGLEAAALHWRGAVSLAEGRPDHALASLRAACRRWRDAGAPHDAARTCALLGAAYLALGDVDGARSELDAARAAFEQLGAHADVRTVDAMTAPSAVPAGLTEREAEVLGHVASGRTNREVAEALVLSEKTIARHLSNIFTKLGVSTRTEAAAFAFEHGIVDAGHG